MILLDMCVYIHINSCFVLNANEAKIKEYFQWKHISLNKSIC